MVIPLDLPVPTKEQMLKEVREQFSQRGLISSAGCGLIGYHIRSRLTPFLGCSDDDYGFTVIFRRGKEMDLELRLYCGDLEAIKVQCAELGYESAVHEPPPVLEVKIEPGTYTPQDDKKWRKHAKTERFT